MSWADRYKEEKIVVQRGTGHNKFWAAHWSEATNTVYVRWGRLGTKGQSREKNFGSSWAAANFIDTKYREKKRKGYTNLDSDGQMIDHTRFEMMCTEAVIVGTSNKCHEMKWVELTEVGDGYNYTEISDERLYAPDCNPGLLVAFETKKEHDNRNRFKFLFTFEETYDVRDANRAAKNQLVTASHPLHGMTTKVEEAIGRRLSPT
jgi:predicted DNA-binding WGR domain protein